MFVIQLEMQPTVVARYRHRRANEAETVPSECPKRAAKDKYPIEKNVDEEENQIIVHCRPRLTLRLEVEAHALIPPVRNRPEHIPLRVSPSKFGNVSVEA